MRHPELATEIKLSRMQIRGQQSWPQLMRFSVAVDKSDYRITHEARFRKDLQGLYSARFSRNGEVIATGFGAGAIQIHNGKTGELRTTLKSILGISMPIMCCRFNPVWREIFYASSACGNIFMCTTDTKELSKFISEPRNEINTIDVSIGGNYLVSGGKDAAVRLYDTGTAKIWDIRVPTGSIRVIKGPHICGDAIDIHVKVHYYTLATWNLLTDENFALYNFVYLIYQETHILTGSWVVRDSLQLWDLMSAKNIETINPQNRPSTLNGEFLYVVQYFDGDPYGELILAGGSGTGAVEMINLKERKVIGNFNVNKPIFTLDSCKTAILFGGMESVLRLGEYS